LSLGRDNRHGVNFEVIDFDEGRRQRQPAALRTFEVVSTKQTQWWFAEYAWPRFDEVAGDYA